MSLVFLCKLSSAFSLSLWNQPLQAWIPKWQLNSLITQGIYWFWLCRRSGGQEVHLWFYRYVGPRGSILGIKEADVSFSVHGGSRVCGCFDSCQGHVATEDQMADIMTKSLGLEKFVLFWGMIGVHSFSTREGVVKWSSSSPSSHVAHHIFIDYLIYT